MQAIMLDEDISMTVANVAKQLKTSHQAVISQAIADYVEKIKQHPSMLSFASSLEERKTIDYAFLNDDAEAQLQEKTLLEKERAIYLKAEDMQVFLQALENPPKITDALKRAAQRHKQLISHA